jgi:hypothetical protein
MVRGGIAPISQAPDRPPGPWLGQEIEESTGQLTSGTIRHVERCGLGGLEGECKPKRDAEVVAGPPCEGNGHEAQHEVQAPQRAIVLPC